MNQSSNSSTTYIVLGAIVLAGLAYWYFFTGNGNAPSLTTTATSSAAEAQFQALANELGPIHFDTTLFSDPRFQTLNSFTAPITPEPSGRTDPFAPLSGISGSGG